MCEVDGSSLVKVMAFGLFDNKPFITQTNANILPIWIETDFNETLIRCRNLPLRKCISEYCLQNFSYCVQTWMCHMKLGTSIVYALPEMLKRTWLGSWRCSCLVIWFCYLLIAKPGNKIACTFMTQPVHWFHTGCVQWIFSTQNFACLVDLQNRTN